MSNTAGVCQVANKLVVNATLTTQAPPTTVAHGVAYPPNWTVKGAMRVKRAMLRLTAAAAMNATAITVWVYLEGAWVRHSVLADVTFTATILSVLVPIEWPIGDRIALAYTVSASTMAVDAFPLETCE